MKNRRILVALLAVAILCVGVGYAATTEVLNFTGKITYDPTLQLVWGTATDEDDLLESVSGDGTDTFTVSMDTSEWHVGDEKSFTVAVNNVSSYAAKNVVVSSVTNADTLSNYTINASISTQEIAAGASATVTVTVRMDSYPDAEISEAEFSFTVTGNQVGA